jgi:GDP-mannose 6-dehydrogenase
VFDPHIQLDKIYGSNKEYVLNAIPHIGKLLESSLDTMIATSDKIVVTQKPTPEMKAKIESSGKVILDLCGCLTA